MAIKPKKMTDETILKDIRDTAAQLKADYGKRNAIYQELENMFLCDWTDKPNEPNIKATLNPTGRNAVLNAVRMIAPVDPQWEIKHTDEKEHDSALKVQTACNQIWTACGRIRKSPVHIEMMTSAFIYGEVHTAIDNTQELLAIAKKTGKNVARAQKVADASPVLYRVYNPRNGYPMYDDFGGTAAYYRNISIAPYKVAQMFGEDAQSVTENASPGDLLDLSLYWNDTYFASWVGDKVLRFVEHGLPFVPVSVTVIEGSEMFDKVEDRAQGLLYTLYKSGLYNRQNLMLTVFFTNMFKLGINPLMVHTRPAGNPDKDLEVDIPNSTVHLDYGEKYDVMLQKGIVDPSFQVGTQIVDNLVTESTIYPQAAGQPLTGSPSFSYASLMAQAGRLPLANAQRRGSWGIAELMEMTLDLYRLNGKECPGINLKPSDMKKSMVVEAKLDVKLPQDKLQLANIAKMITEGDQPMFDHEWARREIFGEGDSDQIDMRVAADKMYAAMVAAYLQVRVTEFQQQFMPPPPQSQITAQPGVMPTMPQGGPQNIPPELLANQPGLPQGGVAEGQGFDTGMGGLPPGMAGMMSPGTPGGQ